MLRCPVCRAEVAQGPQCRRCRADLSLLLALEGQRAQLLMTARERCAQGDATQALQLAHKADDLKSDDDSRRLLATVYLLRRDFGQAWQYYQAR